MPLWSWRSSDRKGLDPVPSPGGASDAASAGQQEVDTGVPDAQREIIPLNRGGTLPNEDGAAPLHGHGTQLSGDHDDVVPDGHGVGESSFHGTGTVHEQVEGMSQ